MTRFFTHFPGTPLIRAFLLLGGVFAGSLFANINTAQAAPVILFNSTTGQTPDDDPWDWLYRGDDGVFGAPGSVINTNLYGLVTLLDTADPNADRAGYSLGGAQQLPGGVVLDRNEGFALSFNLQLISEIHTSPDHAGFSLTVMTADNWGIELGFWNDRIFAQNGNFTHGEEVLYNNSLNIANYTLSVQGNSYCFFAPGMDSPLIGSLRQYSGSGFPDNPYGQNNLIFMGDNTNSGSAQVLITQVGFTPVINPIPEPGIFGFAGVALIGAAVVWRVRRRRRRRIY